jgi:hypothetical protein
MARPLVAFFLAGIVMTSAIVTAQTSEGEAPAALLDKIRAELATEQGVSAADIKVVSAQAVNWPNGALGCPKPGKMYTQAIVPGYRIELEVGGKRFRYHAGKAGAYKRCDNALGAMVPRSSR